jgi:hypothetical protein
MQTVISVFEDRPAAQRAVDRLLYEGFAADDVHLQPAAAEANMAAAHRAETGRDHGVLSSIGHFFASVFDQERPSGYPERYAEAVRRGHPVVVVDAQNPADAQRAYHIAHELGAFDIDERTAQWQEEDRKAGRAPGAVAADGQQAQGHHVDRGAARIFQRSSTRSLRDLFRRHRGEPADDRGSVLNRPASTEGESQIVERGERERATAADSRRAAGEPENDAATRDTNPTPPRRSDT